MNDRRMPVGGYMETPVRFWIPGYANRVETRTLREWRGRVPDFIFEMMRNSVIEEMVGALDEDAAEPARGRGRRKERR